jgi:branched-chain amino acid aminotransferase
MGNNIAIFQLRAGGKTFELLSDQPSSSSIDEATRRLPPGGYTTLRTFHGRRVMRMMDHYDRLEETAHLAGKPIQINRAQVSQALHQIFADNPLSGAEWRVRIILDLEQSPGDLYLLLEPLAIPNEAAYQQGVRVVTRQLQRKNPKAKLTQFIQTATAIREGLPPGINEALMIGQNNRVLEGLSSNFFGVLDGVIWTAEEGVLSGITRSLVLEEIEKLGLPLRLEGVRHRDLSLLEEAFITSASRAVLPVVEIDNQSVGVGQPGPITRQLLERYLASVTAALEPL